MCAVPVSVSAVANRVGVLLARFTDRVSRVLGVGFEVLRHRICIRLDGVSGVFRIRLDIVRGLLLRAVVASGERSEPDGDCKNGGKLHHIFPWLWTESP